jgi:hypothetical protein
MADIQTVWDVAGGKGEYAIQDGSLKSGKDIETAVLISLLQIVLQTSMMNYLMQPTTPVMTAVVGGVIQGRLTQLDLVYIFRSKKSTAIC